MRQTIENVYCRRYRVRREGLSRQLLVRSCLPRGRLILKFLLWLAPGLFVAELARFEQMSAFTERSEVLDFAKELVRDHQRHLPLWRRALGLRPSLRALNQLARLLY